MQLAETVTAGKLEFYNQFDKSINPPNPTQLKICGFIILFELGWNFFFLFIMVVGLTINKPIELIWLTINIFTQK